MRKSFILFLVFLMVFSVSVLAKSKVKVNLPKGTVYNGIGVGFIAGAPSGLSLKTYLSKETALQAGVSWYYYGAFGASVDYLIHSFDIIEVDKGDVGLYFGGGAFINMYYATYYGYGAGVGVGVRVPLGVCYNFENSPIDIFVEAVPSLSVLPGVWFGIGGGLGARYYF